MALVKRDDGESAQLSKKSKVRVLDEDTYEQSLDKIVQRDFFPELKKIRAQNEYLEATENNDVEKLREISERYQVLQTPSGNPPETPASFETPSSVHWSPGKISAAREEGNLDRQTRNMKENQLADPSDGSLDEFLAKHTSEDNDSFEGIMEQARLRQKEKYSWLYKKEEEQTSKRQQSLALLEPKQGDELLQAERPAMIDTWTYKNKNALMYCPEGVQESVKDIINNKTHKKQEIIHKNTRFTKDPFPDDACSESLASAAACKSASQPGKIGVDGTEEKVSASPQVNGYGFVAATPTVEPGVDASPLMTWGTIDGTPFRLDGSDTPRPAATPGPTFKMPEPKKREQLGLALAEKVTKKHREKAREARAHAAAMIGKSPSSNKLERLNTMSPAAKRLASQRLGIKTGTDQALRASYATPSPSHRLNTPKTYNTPCTPATSNNSTPSRNLSLTDDLLKLPKR